MEVDSDNDQELVESLASLGIEPISCQVDGNNAVEPQQSLRNPITLLPEDIFLRIMTIATRGDIYTHARERQQTLLSISQVSQRWRQSALDCKPLWSGCVDYRTDSQSWINVLLERSAPSLMDFGTFSRPVLFPDERPETLQSQILNRVLKEIQRIRVFSYFSDADNQWDVIFSSFHQRHLPHLEAINFYTSGTESTVVEISHPPITFDAPRLQRISMGSLPIDHTPLLALPNLLNLRITPGGLKMDFGAWLSLLHHLPNLQWLTISGVFAEGTSRPSTASKVRLDHLEMLVLVGPVIISLDFLELLVLPLKCSLQLEVTDRDELSPSSKNRIADYMTAVVKSRNRFTRKINMFYSNINESAHLGEFDMSSSSGESFNSDGIQTTSLTFLPDVPFNMFGMYTPPAIISVPLLSLRLRQGNFPLLLSLFTLLSPGYSDVTELDILFDSDRELAPDEGRLLVEKFGAFENLTSLRLLCGADVSILPLLRQNMDSPVFPSLRSISFKEPGSLSPTRAETIKDFIHWRNEIGLPIGLIWVIYHGLDPLERANEFLKLIGIDSQEEGLAEKWSTFQVTEDHVYL